MSGKKKHLKLASLIIVGEGPHDKAFLLHMKDLYDSRNTGLCCINQKMPLRSNS